MCAIYLITSQIVFIFFPTGSSSCSSKVKTKGLLLFVTCFLIFMARMIMKKKCRNDWGLPIGTTRVKQARNSVAFFRSFLAVFIVDKLNWLCLLINTLINHEIPELLRDQKGHYRSRRLCLFWTWWILFTPANRISLRFILIFPSHVLVGCPLFCVPVSDINFICRLISLPFHACYVTRQLQSHCSFAWFVNIECSCYVKCVNSDSSQIGSILVSKRTRRRSMLTASV